MLHTKLKGKSVAHYASKMFDLMHPQGGTLIFSSYVGSGLASTIHPKKISGISSTPTKLLKQPCTLSLRKDPKVHRNDP